MSKKVVARCALAALGAGILGGVAAQPAQAWSETLQYVCSGPGFGTAPSYSFAAVLESDLPATLPYGPDRAASVTTILFVPEEFRAWAQSQAYTTVYPGANVGVALDGVALTTLHQAAPASAVPATPGTWTWTTQPTATTVQAVSLGHHSLSNTSLEITVAFHDATGPRLATTAACTLAPATPPGATVIDGYDVVAATTATAVSVMGNTATATVSSNGTPPVGSVVFTVEGQSVTIPTAAGKASAVLPTVPPGTHQVTAQFVPTQPTQLTTSSATATYTVAPLGTTTEAKATYLPDRELLKARARVTSADGSDVPGKVTFILKRNGATVANVTTNLSEAGVAKTKFRHISKRGTYAVLAKYLGTSAYVRSKDRVNLSIP